MAKQAYPLDVEFLTNGEGGSFHQLNGCHHTKRIDTDITNRKTLRECLKDGNEPCGECIETDRIPDFDPTDGSEGKDDGKAGSHGSTDTWPQIRNS